ncbi:hypothetical protein ABR27_18215 [Enterobacter hormaechei subsp. hormaechei]|nr:hypothetical protein ABR27_18215 [Enterobacter hormaechei subsp. hormaechei]
MLESKILAERKIASGKLVCPLVNSTSKIHYIGHYLVFPQHQHFALDVFKTWLLNELYLGKIR